MSKKKTTSPRSKSLGEPALEKGMTVERIRPLQIVHGAFVVSILSVVGLTLVASRPTGGDPRGAGLVQLVASVGLLLWVVGFAFGHWIYRRRMKPAILRQVRKGPWRGPAVFAPSATEFDKLGLHLRRSWVARQTSWMVGPVLCLFSLQWAIQGGMAAKDGSVWAVGLLPACFFLANALVQWPTRRRQIEALAEALQD